MRMAFIIQSVKKMVTKSTVLVQIKNVADLSVHVMLLRHGVMVTRRTLVMMIKLR